MPKSEEHRIETENELTEFVSQIGPREHAMLFYTGIEDKHRVLFTFIKAGLDGGEAAVYVASEETPGQIRDAMVRFGVDVKRHEESGALKILDYKDVYIVNGRFDASRTDAILARLYDEAMGRGFKGFRTVGEMFCFLEAALTKELLEYERNLRHRFESPRASICAYNTETAGRMGMTELLLDLIQAHRRVGFTGRSLDLVKIHKIRLIEEVGDATGSVTEHWWKRGLEPRRPG